jgi:hypothetical protein
MTNAKFSDVGCLVVGVFVCVLATVLGISCVFWSVGAVFAASPSAGGFGLLLLTVGGGTIGVLGVIGSLSGVGLLIIEGITALRQRGKSASN